MFTLIYDRPLRLVPFRLVSLRLMPLRLMPLRLMQRGEDTILLLGQAV